MNFFHIFSIWRRKSNDRSSLREARKRHATGKAGEKKTANYLRRRGMRIVQRNWKHRKGEIDLIVQDGTVLVFVEVRTRKAGALVSGVATLSSRKKFILRQTVNAYLQKLSIKPDHWRFDVSEVTYHPEEKRFLINYHENVSFN